MLAKIIKPVSCEAQSCDIRYDLAGETIVLLTHERLAV